MPIKKVRSVCSILSLFLALAGIHAEAQSRRPSSTPPQADVQHYAINATLDPESHEVTAEAGITFRMTDASDVVVFELSENLSVQKVTDAQGIELEFGQDESGPGVLAVRFPSALKRGSQVRIKVDYTGGYDRDRYSRNYSRDEGSAYIGVEGSYLLYSSKWFPVSRFLADRATADIEVTVPLGFTVVGPGVQKAVTTKGVSESFGWSTNHPILPNSIVAGRYFEKSVQSDGFTLSCFAREDHVEAMEKTAKTLAGVLDFFGKSFGPPASAKAFRLVEVDDKLEFQHGTLGTIYVTHRELSEDPTPVRQLARRAAYQWWMETVGVQSTEDLWLVDGLAYYAAALYLGKTGGEPALREELNNLAVLALKFEKKSAVRNGLGLGFRSEGYESVVAGKGAWVIHMLRSILGDAKFKDLLLQYTSANRASGGSTASMRQLAEKVHGQELGWFFAQWIDTIGVPELQPEYVVFKTRDGFRVSGTVSQDRDLFRMPLEIEVESRGKKERVRIDLNGKSTPFDIESFTLPKAVVLDPDNKILRDSKELQTAVQITLGNDLKQKGEYVESIRAFEAALKINARKSLAHFRMAEVFWEQFNLQAAANSFRDALNGDKDPAWIEVWCYLYLGKIYDILSQRQRAMAEYNKAINTKDETFGAQEEAKKWIAAPFTRERTTIGDEVKQPAD